MRASGNGNPAVCAQNLVSMTAGECPMDRLRGRNPKLIETTNLAAVKSDIIYVLSVWEPRIDANLVTLTPIVDEHGFVGDYTIDIDAERRADNE